MSGTDIAKESKALPSDAHSSSKDIAVPLGPTSCSSNKESDDKCYAGRIVLAKDVEDVRAIKLMYISYPMLLENMPLDTIGSESFAEWKELLRRYVAGDLMDKQLYASVRHVIPAILGLVGPKIGLMTQNMGAVIDVQEQEYKQMLSLFRRENETWIEKTMSTSSKILAMLGQSVVITHSLNTQAMGHVVMAESKRDDGASMRSTPAGVPAKAPLPVPNASSKVPEPERPYDLFGGRPVEESAAQQQ